MDPWAQFLTSLRLDQLSSNVILGLVVLMILTGKLVPRSVADVWRTAHEKSEASHRVKDATIAKLVDANSVGVRVLDSLPPADPGGEPDVAETTETRRRRRQVGS